MRLGAAFSAVVCVATVCTKARPQELLWDWHGNTGWRAYNDQFGAAVSFMGDVNGDGVVDVLVGASDEDIAGYNEHGAAYLKSGADGATLHKQVGGKRDSNFGLVVAGGGDMDADGVRDYVVGAPTYNGPSGQSCGAAFVYSGRTGAWLHSFFGEAAFDDFGSWVEVLADLDSDGSAEIGVGSAAYDLVTPPRAQSGRVYVYSGSTGTILYTLSGKFDYQSMAAVCQLADLNGDGVGDVGVGSYGWGGGPNGEGQFDIVDGVTGQIFDTLIGEVHADSFGLEGVALGDLDSDGIGDFMVAAPFHTTVPGSSSDTEGRVYVYSGATRGLLYQFDGVQKSEHMGRSPRIGKLDLNGDGRQDFLIGSALRRTGPTEIGVVLAYSGWNGRLLYEFNRLNGSPIDGGLGNSSSFVGDMNLDGIDDVAIGASNQATSGQPSAGHVYVFAGNDLFLQSNKGVYSTGDPITLSIRGGTPGVLGMFVVTVVNGAPMFVPLLISALDSYGELKIVTTVPPGLSGITCSFMGYAQKASGRGLADSIPEVISFN